VRIVFIFLVVSFPFFTTGAWRFAGSHPDSAEEGITTNRQESIQDARLTKASHVYAEPELHRAVRRGDLQETMSVLSSTLQTEHRDGVLYFLSSGEYLSINTRNSRGQSPLTVAVLLSKLNSIEWLLERGARLDLKNNTDRVALEYADSSVKKLLKKYGQSRSFCQRIFRR